MKFLKICEKAKKYLLLITQKEDVEKKKIEKLRKRIDEKISKLQQKIRNSNISLSLYMYYNPPGYEKFLGLQARYFIPLLFILTITISLSKKLFFINDIIKKWIIVITLFSNFYFIINIHN